MFGLFLGVFAVWYGLMIGYIVITFPYHMAIAPFFSWWFCLILTEVMKDPNERETDPDDWFYGWPLCILAPEFYAILALSGEGDYTYDYV